MPGTKAPKQAARIVIRRDEVGYHITCGAELCEFVDSSDEMGAQRLARKHNRDRHGGALIVKFENMGDNRARVRAAAQEDD